MWPKLTAVRPGPLCSALEIPKTLAANVSVLFVPQRSTPERFEQVVAAEERVSYQ